MPTGKTIAILGGTGKEGSGLALRWAHAGHRVIIGSRSPKRAGETAASINVRTGGTNAEGADNLGAGLIGSPTVPRRRRLERSSC